jgi:hypothetical protein
VASPANPAPYRFSAAILSALVPGLGHVVRRQGRRGVLIFMTGAAMLAGAWGLGRLTSASSAIFALMLVGLPWWALQSYAAGLPGNADAREAPGLGQALRLVWERAHDIRYLGALFLLTAFTDLYIIVANPDYALTIFCHKPGGIPGILAKAQSPTLHTLIGYGFMRLRRWALFLYLAYAGFGLLNATANYACFGYGRVRTVFLVTLVAFTLYVLWRRRCFR